MSLAIYLYLTGTLAPNLSPLITSEATLNPDLDLLVGGLDSPTAVATWPGNPNVIVVAERGAKKISRFAVDTDPAAESITPVVDLAAKARFPSAGQCNDLFGLTGVAFHPDFLTNPTKRLIYVRYNADDPQSTNQETVSRIEEYLIPPGTLSADPNSARVILEYPDNTSGHCIGQIVFEKPDTGAGPARLLVGPGDDTEAFGASQPGGGGTPGTGTCQFAVGAQTPGSLTGRILAIDVNAAGTPAPVVLAQGLRNPWGIGVDSGAPDGANRGDIWVGDTGDERSGNVLKLTASGPVPNYGWPCFEFLDDQVPGQAPMPQSGPCTSEIECQNGPAQPDLPVHVLQRLTLYGDAQSPRRDALIGEFVYRGSAMPNLVGRYIFGTTGMSATGSAPWQPKLLSVDALTPNTAPIGELGSQVGMAGGILGIPNNLQLVAIIEGADGEPLLILHNCDRGKGRIYRMIP